MIEEQFAKTNTATPVLMSWSGGKDSCLALHEIQKSPHIDVVALLTTITRDHDRISMHGVRRTLLEKQANSLGLPLHPILISAGATNEEYELEMARAFSEYRARAIDSVVFGLREKWSGRRGSNSQLSAWEADTLPLSYARSDARMRAKG